MNSPRTIKRDSSLADVLKKIIDEKKSRLLVTENNKITGLVSEKDLGVFLFMDTSERKLDEIPLSEIMKTMITVDEKTGLNKCAELQLMKDTVSKVNFSKTSSLI